MYNVQDYSVHNNNAVRPATCKDCHLTYMWKAFAQRHHFIKRGTFCPNTNLTLPLAHEQNQENERHIFVYHLCIRGINFASFYDFSIGFRNCSDSVTADTPRERIGMCVSN